MIKSIVKRIRGIKFHLILIIIVLFAAYANTFPNEFVFDDNQFIKQWWQIKSFDYIDDFFAGSYAYEHFGKYRPLKGVVLTLDYHLFGLNPFGYHAQAILIHTLATILVYLIALKITKIKFIALVTGLIFALHPVHVEAITFMTSSIDIIGIVFLLLSFYLYLKSSESKHKKIFLASSSISWVLALLSNEIALVLPLLIILHKLCFDGKQIITKKSFSSLFPYGGVLFGYLILRLFIVKVGSVSEYFGGDIWLTGLIMVKVVFKYLLLLTWPTALNVDHTIQPGLVSFTLNFDKNRIVPLSVVDWFWFLSFAATVGLIIAAILARKRWPIVSFAIGWFFVSLAPVSNVFFPLTTLLSERYIYLASFGWSLLVGYLSYILWKRKKTKWLSLVLLTALLAFLWWQTFDRNKDWRDSETLWADTVSKSPDSITAHFSLGQTYLNQGRLDEAYKSFKFATEHNYFNLGQYHMGLGKVYQKQGKTDEALSEYRLAVEKSPDIIEGYYLIGNILEEVGDTNGALQAYKKAVEVNAYYFDAYLGLGKMYAKTGDLGNAMIAFEKAKQVLPDRIHSYNNLAAIYIQQGKYELALSELEKALEIDPNNTELKTAYSYLKKYLERK